MPNEIDPSDPKADQEHNALLMQEIVSETAAPSKLPMGKVV